MKLKAHDWWLWLFLWLIMINPTLALELRIAIEKGVNKVNVGTSTTATIMDEKGQILGELDPNTALDAKVNGKNISIGKWVKSEIWLQPKQEQGLVWIGDRWYRGIIHLVNTKQKIIAVNQVDLEQYLYSVLGAEMGKNWPIEALKAQSVAARTYALYERQKANKSQQLYDVSDTTSSQVYKGVQSESSNTQLAVDSTTGQILTYNGQVILAVFHAASGGHTENVENVWSNKLPYLRGVPDYDQGTPGYQWVTNFSGQTLGNKLGVGNIISIKPERMTESGRILTLIATGINGTKRLPGTKVRQILGLRSTLFTITPTSGGFEFQGKGYGHGLGLSQWGAYNLALEGVNYQQILLHYYQGVQIMTIGDS